MLKQALLLHLLIETPASLSFLLAPHMQLPNASPDARLVLRNLGGLLLATNLLCVALLANFSAVPERLMATLCACLGTYHVWPIYRAWARMRNEGSNRTKLLGGPVVHFVVHVLCLGALLGGGGVVLIGEQ